MDLMTTELRGDESERLLGSHRPLEVDIAEQPPQSSRVEGRRRDAQRADFVQVALDQIERADQRAVTRVGSEAQPILLA